MKRLILDDIDEIQFNLCLEFFFYIDFTFKEMISLRFEIKIRASKP